MAGMVIQQLQLTALCMFNKITENKTFKKLSLEKMIYPLITLIIFIIILVLFIKSLLFLSNSINKTFVNNELSVKEEITQLDETNYQLIKKRFNLPEPEKPIINLETNNLEQASSTASTTVATSTTAIETPKPTANKSLVSINILNSTQTSGLALKLQTSLTQAGYKIIKTGNLPVALNNTLIEIKPSNKLSQEFIDEITKIVSEKYIPQLGTNLPTSDNYDVVIKIGNN
jgi:hypothetical protein